MALVSTYSVSGGTVSLSKEFSTLDELLTGILDNNSGAIQAGNIRDGVYTLWQKIDSFSSSLAISATASVAYNSVTPSTNQIAVGGVTTGSTFSGTIQDLLDRVFYPYVSPVPIISPIGSGLIEFGSPTSIVLNYSVSLGTEPITPLSLIVDGTPKSFPPYVSTHNTSGTHSSSTITASESNTFIISVSDGVNTITGTQTLYWMNKIYWGRLNLTSIGNPDLTYNSVSASLVSSLCTDNLILGLNGAGANGLAYGSEFSLVKDKIYSNIDGQGQYLIFAWPSTFPGAADPTFRVNGIVNTAFTIVRSSSPLKNSQGFNGTDYEVWVSNTRYYSPVNIEIS